MSKIFKKIVGIFLFLAAFGLLIFQWVGTFFDTQSFSTSILNIEDLKRAYELELNKVKIDYAGFFGEIIIIGLLLTLGVFLVLNKTVKFKIMTSLILITIVSFTTGLIYLQEYGQRRFINKQNEHRAETYFHAVEYPYALKYDLNQGGFLSPASMNFEITENKKVVEDFYSNQGFQKNNSTTCVLHFDDPPYTRDIFNADGLNYYATLQFIEKENSTEVSSSLCAR
ncbi:MAG TPA: hypothetical protein VLE47_03690 [Candidatus Saccharimonadales bacterium]|nr:hypothetical protein [Candidatus Saccharimonadales bacterium]